MKLDPALRSPESKRARPVVALTCVLVTVCGALSSVRVQVTLSPTVMNVTILVDERPHSTISVAGGENVKPVVVVTTVVCIVLLEVCIVSVVLIAVESVAFIIVVETVMAVEFTDEMTVEVDVIVMLLVIVDVTDPSVTHELASLTYMHRSTGHLLGTNEYRLQIGGSSGS